MEEVFAIILLVTIFLGYVGLCAGVGYFAYKNDQSFVLFFILSIIFSPVPVFVVVLILSVATGSLGASDELKERVNEMQDRAQEAESSDPVELSREGQEPAEEKEDVRSSVDSVGSEAAEEDVAEAEDSGASPSETMEEPSEEQEGESFPWDEDSSEDASFEEDWEDTDDSDLGGEPEAPEGKVRCDVCHSFVDETEERCPACGNRLGS